MHKIIESVELHDTLNPKIWIGYELRDEVKEKLNEIVDRFILELHENDIPVKVLDARLVGSNASFNYTKNSDLDVHIIANFEDTSCDVPVLNLLYNFFKKNFNDKYDISIHGVPVELYVEDMNASAVSNGVYSLFKDEWIKMPEPIEIPDIDITDEFTVYEDKYNKVIENNNAEMASDLVDELYLLRKDSISTDGEYGVGNLVFKEFRNRGYLDNLKQLMVDETSKELSLEHLNEVVMLEGRDAPLYHGTQISNFIDILKTDTLKPGRIYNRDNKAGREHGSISLSRNKNVAIEYGDVVFTLDQSKLSDNYKIIPVGDFENKLDATSARKINDGKAEEIITEPITPLHKYIKKIEILAPENQLNGYKHIIDDYINKFNVDIKFITNESLYVMNESKEDIQKLIDHVGAETADKFLELKTRIKPPQNDLYYWLKKEPVELQDFLNDLESTKSKTQQAKEDKSGADLIYNSDGWKIYKINTYNASKYYGKGTKWCISGNYSGHEERGEEYFNDYKKQGVLNYYFIFSPYNHKWCYLETIDRFIGSRLWDETNNGVNNDFDTVIPYLPKDALYKLPGYYKYINIDEIYDSLVKNVIETNVLIFNKFESEIISQKLGYTTNRYISTKQWSEKINEIVVGGDIDSIETFTFMNLKNLKKVIINDGVKEIKVSAFENCSKLTDVILPESIELIGRNAFSGCKKLKKIYLPKNIKKVGSFAFAECDKKLTILCGFTEEFSKKMFSAYWNVFDDSGIKYNCVFESIPQITEKVIYDTVNTATINESNDNNNVENIKKYIKNNFNISTYTIGGPFYILSNGLYLNLGKNGSHLGLDDELYQNEIIEQDPFDYSYSYPNTIMVDLFNAIRCSDGENLGDGEYSNPYIQLPKNLPTNAQINSLDDWINSLGYNNKLFVDGVEYNLSEVSSEYIIKKIKRYYSSGKLYESSNSEEWLNESKADEQKLIDFVGEETAKQYLKLKPRMEQPFNDLYWWIKEGSPQELKDYVDWLTKTKSKSQLEREAKQGAKLLYNKNGWKIYRIDTYEAATYYGKNTKWCISGNYPGSEGQGQTYFDNYKDNGVINYYFIISPDNHKWCYLHTEDGFEDSVLWNEVDDGFTDIRDDEIPDFPTDAMEVIPGFKEHFKVMTTSEQRLRSTVIRTHVLDYTKETRDILKNYSTVNKPTWLTDYVDKLIIHKDCETVRNEEFLYMDHVQEIIIEDGITEIGVASFALCKRLTKVYIPNTVKVIFHKAFAGCFELKKIYIPSSVEYIGESAFARCNDYLTIYCGIEEEKTIGKYNELWNIKDMAGDTKDMHNYYDCLFNVKRTAVESLTEDVYDKEGYYNPDQDSRYKRLLRTPINKLTRDDIAYLYTIHFTKYSDGYNDNGTQHTYWYAKKDFNELLDDMEEQHGDDFDRTYLFTSNLSFPLTVYRAIRASEKDKNSISGKDGSLSWTTDINLYKKDNSIFRHATDIVSAKITPDMIQNEWTVVNYVLYSANPSYGRYAESEITLKPRFKMDKLQDLKFINKDDISEKFIEEELKTKDWVIKQFSDAFISYTPSQSLLKAKLDNITDGEWEDVLDFVNSLEFPLIIYRGLKLNDISELNTSELGVNWTIDDELFFAPESAFYDSNYIIVTKITEDAIDYPETIQNYIYYSLRPQEGRWAESEITVKKGFKPDKYYILKKENDELVPVN